ncbi:MAG: hypothetical protein HY901_25395 [Deltaproteobacteria bacterium]|nr:hypothetical protein [Deltaproteobacteria bacterium]
MRLVSIRALLAASLLSAAGGAGCSLVVDYDLEGKPCGDGGTCLSGYVCSKDGLCLQGGDAGAGAANAGLVDGGT